MNKALLTASLTLSIFLLNKVRADIVVTTFSPSDWGNSSLVDAPDAVVEDFEDVQLIEGLRIRSFSTSGSLFDTGSQTTLQNTFNPSTDDPFGSVLAAGVWDGNRVLVNTADNQSKPYAETTAWGQLTFDIDSGASSFGFSIQQMEFATQISVNDGEATFDTSTLSSISLGMIRNGYIRIDATDGDTINSVNILNSVGDGYAIDHVTIVAIPEPSSLSLGLLGSLLLLTQRRKPNV